jgi:hypothetical protein
MSLHAINGVVSGEGWAGGGRLKMSLHAINSVVSGGGRTGIDRTVGFSLAQVEYFFRYTTWSLYEDP